MRERYEIFIAGGSWLHLAFCPKILGGGGDLQIIFLLKNACRLSGSDNLRWWDTQNLTAGILKNFYLLHSQVVGM